MRNKLHLSTYISLFFNKKRIIIGCSSLFLCVHDFALVAFVFYKKLLKIRKTYDDRREKSLFGAKCVVLTKYLHPSKKISAIYPNYTRGSKIKNLICIGKEKKVANKVKQNCITFRHNNFENVTLYCVSRWVHVIIEGSQDHFLY